MGTPLELLQSLLTTNKEKCLTGITSFCQETKVFCNDKNKGQGVAIFINSLFSKLDNEGALLILQTFIPQCPRDVLNANILSWIQHCNKTLINTKDGSISRISFKLLCELIRLSVNFSEARKEVALSVIPKSLDHFIREAKRPREDILVILQCIEQTLDSYGKTCGSHKEEILSLVFSFMESSTQNVYACAKCYLKLAASGSPGANCENYANNWILHEKYLLNTLHRLMDSLFENIDVHQDSHRIYNLGDYRPNVPEIIEKSLLRRKQRLATYFQSFAEFLCVHLLGSFPAPKHILPQSILSVIWRGLSVNCSTLMNINVSADISSLLTVISEVNVSCLKLLNALIVSCRMNLLSYSPFICRIISQILNWTNVQNWPYAVGKPHRSIRVEAYSCATNWLTVSHACSGVNKHLDDILSSVISDINIEPPILTLKVPSSKGKGKKHKQQKAVPVTLEHIINNNENEDICKAALDVIPVMLSSLSTVMKPEQHKHLQEIVVNKLLQIQHTGSSGAPLPYSSESCRVGLYKSLLFLCNNYHPSFPPPINYAKVIFSKGMKDSSLKVLTFCIQALNNIENILKPQCPPMEFPTLSYDLNTFNSLEIQRTRNVNNTTFSNSTPVRDVSTSGHSFLQNLEKSGTDQTFEKIDKQTASFQIQDKEQGFSRAGRKPESESLRTMKKNHISNRNVKDTVKEKIFDDETEDAGNLSSEDCEIIASTTSSDDCEIINTRIVDTDYKTPVKDNTLPSSSSECVAENKSSSSNQNSLPSTTDKKRDLEEKDDSESLSPKRIKVNGISGEQCEELSITANDSDDEMLNSFVDEVIEV